MGESQTTIQKDHTFSTVMMKWAVVLLASLAVVSAGWKTKFAKAGLKAHNALRDPSHKLKLDKKLCKEAQAYANELAAKDVFQHADLDEKGQGENLHMAGPWIWSYSDGSTKKEAQDVRLRRQSRTGIMKKQRKNNAWDTTLRWCGRPVRSSAWPRLKARPRTSTPWPATTPGETSTWQDTSWRPGRRMWMQDSSSQMDAKWMSNNYIVNWKNSASNKVFFLK